MFPFTRRLYAPTMPAMRQMFLFDNLLTGQIPLSIRNLTLLSTGMTQMTTYTRSNNSRNSRYLYSCVLNVTLSASLKSSCSATCSQASQAFLSEERGTIGI